MTGSNRHIPAIARRGGRGVRSRYSAIAAFGRKPTAAVQIMDMNDSSSARTDIAATKTGRREWRVSDDLKPFHSHLLLALFFALLILDVLANHQLIQAYGADAIPLAQKYRPVQFLFTCQQSLNIRIADFPFRKPTVFATLNFGGIINNMWIWSVIA